MFYGHNRKISHRRAPKTFGGVGTLVSKNVYNWYDVSVIDNCVDGIQAVQFIDKASHYSFIVYNCYLPPSKFCVWADQCRLLTFNPAIIF